jgi:ribonuclease HII
MEEEIKTYIQILQEKCVLFLQKQENTDEKKLQKIQNILTKLEKEVFISKKEPKTTNTNTKKESKITNTNTNTNTDTDTNIKIKEKPCLLPFFYDSSFYKSNNTLEICVDEAGRGPLFGPVYCAAVILPLPENAPDFDFTLLKDSKKFHSKQAIRKVSDYIKAHALAYSITFSTEKTIDEINILQATMRAMHEAITNVHSQIQKEKEKEEINKTKYHLLIDGNYFRPVMIFHGNSDNQKEKENAKCWEELPYKTIEGGDDKYAGIAAASILAKVARDDFIMTVCNQYPELKERYSIDKNMGYGAKIHTDGIKKYGITEWHRKTFGICKQYNL